MAKVNELSVESVVKNGKTYKNIRFENLGSGDKVVIKKLDDVVKRADKTGTKFNPEKKWVMCQGRGEYNGEQVGFFFPSGWSSSGYKENTFYADQFDKAGKAGDSIEVSVVNGFGKDSKGKDIVVKDYSFTKVA
jgi:hypothetical protein